MSSRFDRPVFIMAAPRSCSTLLFQTLAHSNTLWSLGDESHRLFESHAKLSPGRGFVDSNRLGAELLDEKLAASINAAFLSQVKDRSGAAFDSATRDSLRLLEKTPKHALRIPFIDALFPDALFIYLFREPRQNIASIIDAWRAGNFVTYPRFRTVHGPWSLLLPPDWQAYVNRPLEEIAAFQWIATNRIVMDDLAQLPRQRWTAINAQELLDDPPAAVARLCAFMDVPLDATLLESLQQPLPLSRYTITRPDADKWEKHRDKLECVWRDVAALIPDINRFVSECARPLAAALPRASAQRDSETQLAAVRSATHTEVSRNQSCPCGSGRRYKTCHGQLA